MNLKLKRNRFLSCSSVLALFSFLTLTSLPFAFAETSPSNPQLILSLDNRPSDGALNEITLSKLNNVFKIDQKKAYFDRMNGKEVEEVKVLASRIPCDVIRNGQDNRTLSQVICRLDKRAFDGNLIEFTISLKGNNAYEVKLLTSYFNRVEGKVITNIEDLGTNLKIDQDDL